MEYKILASKWRSGLHTIGFVAYDTGFEGQWNAVVGYNPNALVFESLGYHITTEEDDLQYIAAHGGKLSWQEARVIFPELDLRKFKYAPAYQECKKCGQLLPINK